VGQYLVLSPGKSWNLLLEIKPVEPAVVLNQTSKLKRALLRGCNFLPGYLRQPEREKLKQFNSF